MGPTLNIAVERIDGDASDGDRSLLDLDPVLLNAVHPFDQHMSEFEWRQCVNCSTRFPGLSLNQASMCSTCVRNPRLFTAENNMDPGEVPALFSCLSVIEQLLIAQIHPVVSVYRPASGQLSYSGTVINFLQNVHSFAKSLPHPVGNLRELL